MYDLLVVGAGTGGCLTAWTASRLGLKTCLIDAKSQGRVGDKACGDAVGKHHFDNLGLAYPKGDEYEGELSGCRLYSPSRRASLLIEGLGAKAFMVKRHAFGQRLLKEAQDAGASFLDKTQALTPVIQGGFVAGVSVIHLENGEKEELLSRIVVDATGVQGVLRSKLPEEFGMERHISPEDIEVAYREILQPKRPLDSTQYGEIYLTNELAPGGYAWLFPKGGSLVNAGLGVQMRRGHPHPRERFLKFLEAERRLRDARVLDRRGAQVPTRRPIDSLVANGFMVVGDAACQVNPIHGGGIGPSMIGGKMAAEAAAKAVEKGDLTRRGLWSYNVSYMRGYGAKQATLDVFRRFLQAVDDDDLDHGLEHRVIREEDILKASLQGRMKLSISEKAQIVFRA
ncbi:MAG: geranylgeranyl reductase family protein, partial [Candidatus Bathyarchaeia archaeon]